MVTAFTFPLVTTPTAAPISTFTLSGPPSTQYLHPNTAKDRLNHTLNSLAIGLESVQPITTAIILPRMQLPTPMAPQLSTPRISHPFTLSGPPLAQYLHPSTTNTDPAIRLYRD